MRNAGHVLLIFVLLAFAQPARAADAPKDECQLLSYLTLPLTTQPDGRVTVPVTINGRDFMVMVDTGGVLSAVSENTADALELKRRPFPFGSSFEFYGRQKITHWATVDNYGLGPLQANKLEVTIMPNMLDVSEVSGLIAPNLFGRYDVDIDFKNETFTMFSTDHCPGRVVHWTNDTYAKVPMTLDTGYHIRVPVTLDGKDLIAIVDTGAAGTSMTVERARDLFGWGKADTDKLVPIRGGGYRYPFGGLKFEGIEVHNPDILLLPEARISRRAPELLLGANILRQLHLYIAYGEKNLYLTSAEAAPIAPQAPSTH